MSKITHITVNNIKRVRSADVTPGTHLFVVGGKNYQGKSSFLDAIKMAFCGAKVMPPKPILDGEKEGEIIIELDDGFRIRQRHTESGPTTTLSMTKDGIRSEIKSPQAMLNVMAGSLAIDPLKFADEKPQKQCEILRELVGIDTTELDKKRDELFALRTDVNRTGKDLRAQFDAMPLDADAPTEPVDTGSLTKQLAVEQQRDRDIELTKSALSKMEAEFQSRAELCTKIEAEIERLKLSLQQNEQALSDMREKIQERTRAIEQMPPGNTAEIFSKIASASETNKRYEQSKRRAELSERLEKMRAESASLTTRIDEIDARKQAMIEAAKFPVEGLGFAPDGITYLGIPFEQASDSQKIKVCLAIASALAPRLRCCLIRNGNDLDDDGLAELAAWAEENDMQIIMERVGTGDECSIVMHDGRVKE